MQNTIINKLALQRLKGVIDKLILAEELDLSDPIVQIAITYQDEGKKMTKRQIEVLNFIIWHIAKTGLPPTRSEISQHFGFKSCNSAQEHLKTLEKKGIISLSAGYSRAITIK